ncbi:MAG: Panacea domain-containing protein [Culicoidibacterales bacterium]
MEKEVNIFDVASYIYEQMQGKTLSTMKLQKLCYYAQAWSLAWDDMPLFKEDFQAWANGPVCPELYRAHRGHFSVDDTLFAEREITPLNDEQKETINIVLADYGDKEPYWLSELTHAERPWKETRGTVANGERSNAVISKELMQEYYSGILSGN